MTTTDSTASGTPGNALGNQLWTEKYKPKKISEIIGNKILVDRIAEWLKNWQRFANARAKGIKEKYDKNNINFFRSILISGPPGIGKTTTAHLVAEACGYEILEFNASDVRSRKALEENISEMVDNRTMTEFFVAKPKENESLKEGKKVVLIMDEVDGMTSGDRGGSVLLASLIKKTKIPVICICNDIRSQKVQPLINVCFDARFIKTPTNQLRSRFFSIAFREKIKLNRDAIDQIIESSQNDIRQIFNILATYQAPEEVMDKNKVNDICEKSFKDSQLQLFDIPSALMSSKSWDEKTISEKSDVYFQDYMMAPLMIAENYLKCEPDHSLTRNMGTKQGPNVTNLMLMAAAADSIADGDVIDAAMHGRTQDWTLMPIHSVMSCVRPASFVRGNIGGSYGRLNFTSWMGHNSKTEKNKRQLHRIKTRMRLKANSNRSEIRKHYIPALNKRIFSSWKKGKYKETIETMDAYYIDRELLDVLGEMEFNKSQSMYEITTAQKSGLTRAYNKGSHPSPFPDEKSQTKKLSAAAAATAAVIKEVEEVEDDVDELMEEW
ncbi:replication factor RFC1 C terminal domain-containing protein [Phycomyces nitens]|nr:replication factor RFC1 C terminal domain-containing protein [Phycomyces nitens]